MHGRDFVETGAALAASGSLAQRGIWADVPDHLWQGCKFPAPRVVNRLDQEPLGIGQDEAWFTIFVTHPSRGHIRNFRTGLT